MCLLDLDLDEEKLFQNDERKYLFVSFFTSSYKTPDDEDGDSEEKVRGVEMKRIMDESTPEV